MQYPRPKKKGGVVWQAPVPKKKYEWKNMLTGSEEESELIAHVTSKYNAFLNETNIMRRQWLINAAFVRGQQFAVLHRTEDRLIYLQEPGKRKQITDDMIGPWVEHIVANMVTALPSFTCEPESFDPDAVRAARTGTSLLSYYWYNWKFINDYINLAKGIITFGNTFIFLNYEEDGTKRVPVSVIDVDTGKQALNESGKPIVVGRIVGDITANILDPHCIVCPLDSTELDNKPWLIIAQRKPIDYFKSEYENGDEVVIEPINTQDMYKLSSISQTKPTFSTKDEEMATELLYLQKPSNAAEGGIFFVVSGGVLLKKRSKQAVNPFPFKNIQGYPVIHFHWMKETGEFFARSPIERQIPLQKAINLVWSILLENIDDMAHLKWIIATQHGNVEITDDNAVIKYNAIPGISEPHQGALPPLPNYMMEAINALTTKIRDAQKYHGASMGSSVSGVRSDLHAQNLQEQDLLPLIVTDNLMRIAFERMGEKILAIAAEKMTDERMIGYIGKNKRWTIEKFKGEMLKGTPRIRVTMTNSFMRSKTAVKTDVMNMFQWGMITDMYGQPDPVKAMKLLEFMLPESAFMDYQTHTDGAYNTIDRIMQGENPPVVPWQNHKIYLDILQDYMNSPEFMELYENAAQDQHAQNIVTNFTNNIQQHSKYLQEALKSLQQPIQSTES